MKMDTTLHDDGTVTFWSVYHQCWVERAEHVNAEELGAMPQDERALVKLHLTAARIANAALDAAGGDDNIRCHLSGGYEVTPADLDYARDCFGRQLSTLEMADIGARARAFVAAYVRALEDDGGRRCE